MRAYRLACLFALLAAAVATRCTGGRAGAVASPTSDTLTVASLQRSLRPHPRLILAPADLPAIAQLPHYAHLREYADGILTAPVLEREVIGRRLLATSREALRRTTTLALVYRASGERVYLDRLGAELLAVSAFADWNPSHYLDVAEMAMAVALGLDWTDGELPPATEATVREALFRKGVLPALEARSWVTETTNWNQVCHAGSVAAALALADEHPAEAVRIVNRALRNAHFALESYAPDGVYPEGPTYWAYGTAFSVLQIEALRSALGDDFGLDEYPGFLESATWLAMSQAPSGKTHNFGDCSEELGEGAEQVRAWFAAETGNATLVDADALLAGYADAEKIARTSAVALPWVLRAARVTGGKALPGRWSGGGPNPVALVAPRDGSGYWLAAKGGRATISHGNLDAGSFVFELDGVRWGLDLGSQPYHPLEAAGLDLWGRGQNAERWTLLTKSNHGHSTLTVDGSLHRAAGFASLTQDAATGEIRIVLDSVLGAQLAGAVRRYVPVLPQGLRVVDSVRVLPSTQTVRWQMMTTAEVALDGDRATLTQDGRRLNARIVSPAGLRFAVTALDPPPLALDKLVPGLKRLDVVVPATLARDGVLRVEVAMEGQ